jgi:hypothetical protein
MENKLITFNTYRYHLLPLDKIDKQIDLFPNKTYTHEELKANKNNFFKALLDNLANLKEEIHPLKLENNEGSHYLFKIAQKKSAVITKNFKKETVNTEPYAYIIFNNDDAVQKIAISDNDEAFSNPEVVKNILQKIFNRDLKTYRLNIEIEQLFSAVNFWEYVNKHNDQITLINFQFVKPNLAQISKSLPEVFKAFSDDVNGHKSQIIVKAPEKGTLTNINENNSNICGLVNYTSEGGGSIKLKIKSVRKQFNSKENPSTVQIREIEMEGSAEQVFKLYKNIVE